MSKLPGWLNIFKERLPVYNLTVTPPSKKLDLSQYQEGSELYYIKMFQGCILYDFEKDHYLLKKETISSTELKIQIVKHDFFDLIPVNMGKYEYFGDFVKANILSFIKSEHVNLYINKNLPNLKEEIAQLVSIKIQEKLREAGIITPSANIKREN